MCKPCNTATATAATFYLLNQQHYVSRSIIYSIFSILCISSIFLSMYLSINQYHQYQSIHPLDYNAASKFNPPSCYRPRKSQESIRILQPSRQAVVLWPRPRRDGWMYLPGPTCEACGSCGIQWDPVQHLPSCQQLVPLVGY